MHGAIVFVGILFFHHTYNCFRSAPGCAKTVNERVEQGKVTTYIVNFWATWCAPCIKEIPHFEKLQQEIKSDKLKVLLVSVDFLQRYINKKEYCYE